MEIWTGNIYTYIYRFVALAIANLNKIFKVDVWSMY